MSCKTVESSNSPKENSSVRSRLSSLGIVPFGFHAKTSYDAEEDLLQSRSENFNLPLDTKEVYVWNRPPPDFRYILYDPKPPKRNTVDSMRPWEYGTVPGQREILKRKRKDIVLPRIFTFKDTEPGMITRFHIDRPFTAKKKFVSLGMYKPGIYESPKPHDFRQYPPLKTLGLPEFVTSYERDPFNLKLKSQRLNYIHGLASQSPQRDLAKTRQMAPPAPLKEKWEADLILEKDPWPPRSATYTRHRRRHRQAYSAFMERVEGALAVQWAKEQQMSA